MEPTRGMPTRRTLLRTALWSAPVIAVAAAAPAFAASPTTLTFKISSGVNAKFRLVVTGGATGLALSISSITSVPAVSVGGVAGTSQLFAGGSVTFDANNNNSFVSGTLYTINFSYDGKASSITVAGGGSNSVLV